MSELKYESLRDIKKKDLMSEHITYHVDKKYITVKRDGHEFYQIDKNRLLTEKKRLEWVAHMGQKNWVDNYTFFKTMLRAITVMDLS